MLAAIIPEARKARVRVPVKEECTGETVPHQRRNYAPESLSGCIIVALLRMIFPAD
jgi:hypothetical protein